ncbi:class I SAM-dependent methyltransferase [Vibrio sp. AK197]
MNYYDDNAQELYDGTINVEMTSLYEQFIPYLNKGACILDAGYGSDRDTLAFKSLGFRVHAIDASSKLANLAEKLIGQPVEVTTFRHFRSYDEFDAIWACASLLLVPYDELELAFNNLSAHLKPLGMFYCSFKDEKEEMVEILPTIKDGYERKSLTHNIPFLSGYQGNVCFYCGEPMGDDIHVDHVLSRQFINHDEVWKLVLAHGDCNLLKLDRLVGEHFIRKLIARNENIMGNNHPWKVKIQKWLGNAPKKRASNLNRHYNNIKSVLGRNYWGGEAFYTPEKMCFIEG